MTVFTDVSSAGAYRFWLRNAVVALASGTVRGDRLVRELLAESPLQGLTTAAVGLTILLVFRGWPAARTRAL